VIHSGIGNAPSTTTEYIQLVHVDAQGAPTAPIQGGDYLHWVVVSAKPNMTPVNQMTAGGAYPTMDCGEASVASVLAGRVSVREIENEVTGNATGTTAVQLVKALAANGLHGTVHTGTAPSGYVMNPDFGKVARWSADLLALASANTYVVVV
jgi:hypothetical protein